MGSSDSDRQLQIGAARQEVKGRPETKELLAFREFCKTVASDVDLGTLLKEALEKILGVFEVAEAGAVFLYQPGPDRLVAECALGYDTDALNQVSFRSGESIAGKVFRSGQGGLYATLQKVAEATADMTPENQACFGRAMCDCKQPRSAVCVPLICGDVKLGVVVLENWRGRGEFSESDLELAWALVNLVAVAADRARLVLEIKDGRTVMENLSRLQQDIMATLSHEMRTPLASIKGYASALLLDEVQWDMKTEREYLEVIMEESDKLGEIVADLLDASVIDAGRLKIEKEPTLLARLAQEVVDEVAPRTEKHRFLVSFAPGFPVVDADSGRIRRVLFNVADNAVKYSPGGGLVVVRGEVSENEVIISVADQGQGIAPEHLNRLFERFFRVKFVSGQHVVGSGLGLPIARNIVEAHGGRIWAESKRGEGTTVYFTLPRGGLSNGVETADD
jgi:signal transduction histidine kinase